MVCPTISGMMVERRDHVRSTFFSLREFMASTRVCKKPSTNGPFFVERAIKSDLSFQSAVRLLTAAVDNESIRTFVISRLIAARRLSPRSHRMTAARSLAFAAAMRMIDRVHGNAAVYRAPSHPTNTSCLAYSDVFVIRIPHLSDGRHAL